MCIGDSYTNICGKYGMQVQSLLKKALTLDIQMTVSYTHLFSTCSQITLPISAGTSNVVFSGSEVHVIGANVIATQSATNTNIKMFDSNIGSVSAEAVSYTHLDVYKRQDVGNAQKQTVLDASGGRFPDLPLIHI